MFHRGTILSWLVVATLIAFARPVRTVAHASQAQRAPSASAHTSAAHSQEPYVVEQYRTVIRFENDGTWERVLTARIRVQSAAAVERFSQLAFPYNASNEQVEVRRVVVREPNGASKEMPHDAVKDVAAQSNADAPKYPGDMAKQVSVPGLTLGDTLDYEVVTRLTKPFGTTQFWLQYDFISDAIVLDEQLELNLPLDRTFSLKAPAYTVIAGKVQQAATPAKGFSFSRADESGRILLRWRHTNSTLPTEDERQRAQEQARKSPDIQLTTFTSWQEVARWESKLEQGADQPSAGVTAKTADVINGRASKDEKVRALYDYVSKNVRLVNASFGSRRFQSMGAADVLKDGYGDCEDIHALLTSMLTVAEIRPEMALLPAARKLDVDLPSPAQFDRVLTVIPGDADRIWLHPSAGVAPFGFLPASLRGKSALLISPDGSGKIVKTPADPPFASTQHVEIEGSVSELGKLSATIHYSVRGDTEFVLRDAFHNAPQSQWNELAQTILTLDGLHAEVASVKTSEPFETDNPFDLDIRFSQQNFLDWSSKKTRIALPLLTIGMPDPPANSKEPIVLGSPLEVDTHLTLKFPSSFSMQAPIGVEVARDYAAFKASYQFESGTLNANRSLNFKMRDLPPSRAADYLAFTHAVEADEAQLLTVENTATEASLIPASASADDLFDAGTAALKSGNPRAAIPLLQRVSELDPKHAHAWNDLGLAYLRVGKFDNATTAFRKQLEVDPSDEHANDYLGLALKQQRHDDEAAAAFRKQIELNPLDTVAHAALGTILLEQHDDSGAVLELEKATILSPENSELEVSLGRAYLNTGEKEKALAAFHKGVDLSPTPTIWNNVAYSLADHDLDLGETLKYAQSATAAGAESLANVNLSHVTQSDFSHVSRLAAYWDTLGWIYFHQGDLQRADHYIRAAWRVSGSGTPCDHLAQIYEKTGQKERAIQTYALALAAPDSTPDTRARLILLLGGNSQIDELVAKAKSEAAKERTFVVKGLGKEDGSADFVILLSAHSEKGSTAARVDGVKFLSGTESLRAFGDRLSLVNYGEMFPGASAAKLVLRGTLTCSAPGDCSFTLVTPAIVGSRN